MKQNHIPKKKFGQNFLTAPYYVERIVDAVPAESGENVVEIGPGKGALSKYLVKRDFKYTLIEMDTDVIPILKEELGDREYTVVNGDAVKFDYTTLGDSFHAVGNLPYNVASHIIKKLLFTVPELHSGTFMVQKEVADRICATPGGKEIGFMTILCNYFGATKKLFDVPPGAFFPKPKVTSAVFHITLEPSKYNRLPREDWKKFFELVSTAYGMRRKKLANSVAKYVGGKPLANEAIERAGISIDVRPEELNTDQWVALYKKMNEVKNG